MSEASAPLRTAYGWRAGFLLLTVALCAGASAAMQKAPTARSPMARATLGPATWTRETTFGEAIDSLRNATRPPLNIVVLWRPIRENADLFRETPIGFDSIPGLRVRQYLDLLLLSISSGTVSPLRYVVDGGAVIIGTEGALPIPRSVPRVYDVSDLVSAPSYAPSPGTMRMMFGGGLMGGGTMGGYGQGPGQGFGTGFGGYTTGTGVQGLVGSVTSGSR